MGADLAADATRLLQRLIRFDTVNPPGNERPAVEHLRDLLESAGLQCELLGAEPERPNLVARLRARDDGGTRRGAGEDPDGTDGPEGAPWRAYPGGHKQAGKRGPTLCYLGHVDTVLAHAHEWRRDPWSGELADGFVWGRGALDMKSQVAAEVAAVVSLARTGWRPARGELLLVAVVDEETGGEKGAKWLCEQHPRKVRCDLLVNEGGGASFELDGRRHYGVCCAEKGVFRFTVTAHGAAAHASMPGLGDNALLKLAPVLERFANRKPSLQPTAEPLALLRALVGDTPKGTKGDPDAALERLRDRDARLARMVEPMLAVTFSPTMISASEKLNVIPSLAQLHVDCRVPAGLGEAAAREAIDEVLGDLDGLDVEFTERIVGNRSPMASPLMEAIEGWVAERDPGACAVPIAMPGFTDSRHFRAAFPECVAYGLFPHREQPMWETQALMHAPDERIDVRDLALASELYRDLALRLLG